MRSCPISWNISQTLGLCKPLFPRKNTFLPKRKTPWRISSLKTKGYEEFFQMSGKELNGNFPLPGISVRFSGIVARLGGKKEAQEKLGLSKSILYNYLKEDQDMKLSVATKACDLTGICLDWLATGQGPVHRHEVAEGEKKLQPKGPIAPFLAEAELSSIDTELNNAGGDLYENPNKYNHLRERLKELAQPGCLHDNQRAQALMMLDLAFNDESARTQRTEREKALVRELHRVSDLIDRAETSAVYRVPDAVRENLKSMLLHSSVGLIDLVKLLESIRNATNPDVPTL